MRPGVKFICTNPKCKRRTSRKIDFFTDCVCMVCGKPLARIILQHRRINKEQIEKELEGLSE